MDKAVKRYLTQLRRALTCGKADRERFFSRGRTMVEEFWAETPNAHYEDLVTAFGQPKDFAAEMLSQLDPGEVERAGRQRKYIRRGILAVIVIVLALASVRWYSMYQKSQSLNDNAIIVIEPAREMTEKDVQSEIEKIREGK